MHALPTNIATAEVLGHHQQQHQHQHHQCEYREYLACDQKDYNYQLLYQTKYEIKRTDEKKDVTYAVTDKTKPMKLEIQSSVHGRLFGRLQELTVYNTRSARLHLNHLTSCPRGSSWSGRFAKCLFTLVHHQATVEQRCELCR